MILGIDEVGRGPWAGPLVVGAVILGPQWKGGVATGDVNDDRIEEGAGETGVNLHQYWLEFKDSKKLSLKKREELSEVIEKYALATGLGWVSSGEIDQYGLGSSLKLAARRAVKQVLAQKVKFDEIIIDGTINLLQDTPLAERVTVLKKGDDLIKEISAASIIAKVARDRYMQELAIKYPAYGFEKHVGYGTAAHKAALERFGVTPEHRTSFRPIQKIIANDETSGKSQKPDDNQSSQNIQKSLILDTTTKIGQHAEQIVADFLRSKRHQIVAQNYRTASYEIDIISTLEQKIFFTEVKYRKNSQQGTALAQITPEKYQQMTFAAEKFQAETEKYADFEPILAAAAVEGPNFALQAWTTLG